MDLENVRLEEPQKWPCLGLPYPGAETKRQMLCLPVTCYEFYRQII